METVRTRVPLTALWGAIGALLVIAVVGLATVDDGSSGGGTRLDAKPAAEVVHNAAAAAKAAPGNRFTFEMAASGGGISFGFTMHGVTAAGGTRGEVTETVPIPSGGSVDLHLVQDGRTGYIEVPAANRKRSGGKQWVSFDSTSLMPQGLGNDPLSNLDALSSAGSKVTTVGHETIDGVHTTHYRAVVDAQNLVNQMTGLKEMTAGVELPTFPIDVWIDDNGLPRQMIEKFNLQTTSFRGEMHITDYGKAPSIAVPLPAQTFHVASPTDAIAIVVGK